SLERHWQSALDLIRADGRDPEQVVAEAAKNVEMFRPVGAPLTEEELAAVEAWRKGAPDTANDYGYIAANSRRVANLLRDLATDTGRLLATVRALRQKSDDYDGARRLTAERLSEVLEDLGSVRAAVSARDDETTLDVARRLVAE